MAVERWVVEEEEELEEEREKEIQIYNYRQTDRQTYIQTDRQTDNHLPLALLLPEEVIASSERVLLPITNMWELVSMSQREEEEEEEEERRERGE